MTTADPDLPPYEAGRLLSAPFPERVRLVCRTWASQVTPNPFIVLVKWKIVYAASGPLEEGHTELEPMRALQPWPTGEYAEALVRGRSGATA